MYVNKAHVVALANYQSVLKDFIKALAANTPVGLEYTEAYTQLSGAAANMLEIVENNSLTLQDVCSLEAVLTEAGWDLQVDLVDGGFYYQLSMSNYPECKFADFIGGRFRIAALMRDLEYYIDDPLAIYSGWLSWLNKNSYTLRDFTAKDLGACRDQALSLVDALPSLLDLLKSILDTEVEAECNAEF